MTKRSLAIAVVALAIGAASLPWIPALAFDPQPDPPAFGMVSVLPGETLQLHAVCSEHGVGKVAAKACAGVLMLHDADGAILAKGEVRLKPGQTATLEYTVDPSRVGERVGIIPCIIPNPLGGRLLPTAEVVAGDGSVRLFVNPLTPRLSFLSVGYNES